MADNSKTVQLSDFEMPLSPGPSSASKHLPTVKARDFTILYEHSWQFNSFLLAKKSCPISWWIGECSYTCNYVDNDLRWENPRSLKPIILTDFFPTLLLIFPCPAEILYTRFYKQYLIFMFNMAFCFLSFNTISTGFNTNSTVFLLYFITAASYLNCFLAHYNQQTNQFYK